MPALSRRLTKLQVITAAARTDAVVGAAGPAARDDREARASAAAVEPAAAEERGARHVRIAVVTPYPQISSSLYQPVFAGALSVELGDLGIIRDAGALGDAEGCFRELVKRQQAFAVMLHHRNRRVVIELLERA